MTRKKPTAGIVLAAGMSSRFGRPKQLMELGGKTVLEWTLSACLDSRLESIYLILGYVPFYFLGEQYSYLTFFQVFKQRISSITVEVNFGKHGKRYAIVQLAELLDITFTARLLSAKLITGKTKHHQSTVHVL